jgi:hypothetical protein
MEKVLEGNGCDMIEICIIPSIGWTTGKYRMCQKELYNGIRNVTVWRV